MTDKYILLVVPNPQGPGPGRFPPLFPSLAAMQVAALTPERYKVLIVDESVNWVGTHFPAALVGITATMTAVRPRAIELAKEFQKNGTPVVFGGVDPSFAPNEYLEYGHVFAGEAEGGWADFLDLFDKGTAPRVFRVLPHPSLADIPDPRRDLLDLRVYPFRNPVQTGRGCPNSCDFCSVWCFSGRNLRYRPIGHVIRDVSNCPAGPIEFVDDNILSDFDRTEELFQAMLPLHRIFFAQADTSLLQRPDLAFLGAKSGWRISFTGFESFNPASIREANKSSVNKIEDYQELIKLYHRAGISVIPSNILGFDTDDENEADRCFRELNRLKADAPQFSVLTPLPGTKLDRRMQREGRIVRQDPGLLDGLHAVYEPRKRTIEELEGDVQNLYRRWYRARGILWRLISDPWFWRHPFRRLNTLRILAQPFLPRIWSWVKRSRRT